MTKSYSLKVSAKQILFFCIPHNSALRKNLLILVKLIIFLRQ